MSCLFNSLSYFCHIDSMTIRQQICDYLESNHKIIDGMDTKFILEMENNNYINNMRKTSSWGGGIEIQVACNLYSFRIIVRNKRDNTNIEFLPVSMNYNKTIELEWTGGHYEPVRQTFQFSYS